MKANGISAELHLLDAWVLEDETMLYFFNCSECALAWIVENKPEFIESPESENWRRERRWCTHDEPRPLIAIDKSLLNIQDVGENIVISMKE